MSRQKFFRSPSTRPGAMVWVSPSGNDANSGSSAQPLATLLAARNKVRTIIANGRPAGSIVVNVRSGRYQQSETLDFVEGDSGTPEAPVIWRAVDGPVWVTGSVATPANAYQVPPAGMANLFPATIRSQIRMVDLAALGVSTPIESNDRDGWTATGASIVVDGTGLTLARYPNTGWLAVESGSTAGGATDPVVLSTIGYDRFVMGRRNWRCTIVCRDYLPMGCTDYAGYCNRRLCQHNYRPTPY